MARVSSGKLLLVGATGLLAASYAAAQVTPAPSAPKLTTAPPITFTEAQVRDGRALFLTTCAACHGPGLAGGEARPLKGRTFLGRFTGGGGSLGSLYKFIHDKMPPGGAGTLTDAQIANLVALILEENGQKPGNTPLPSDYASLQKMRLPYTGDTSGGLSLDAKLPPWPATPNPAAKLSPVTDAMLQNPPPGDWLTWRRTLDGQGFSPLDQITKANVRGLRLAWSFNLAPGPNASTPLVHDGVIFVYSNRDQVDALNAATGDILWTYKREFPASLSQLPMRVKRNMAIYGDRLYLATGDNKVIALDTKTGALVWESPTGPASGGPLVVDGKVIEGLFRGDHMPSAAELAGDANAPRPAPPPTCPTCGGYGRILGLSSTDGKKLWNFNVVPQPGEPGTNSWNDIPQDQRSGGSVWTTGYYDPALDLVFIGTGNTYNTGPLARPVGKPGVTADALYTDSTLAIRPSTGKLAWFYQHHANDLWDFDWVFEQIIADLPVDGKPTKTIVTMGKTAIVDALQAANGKYLFSIDAGIQNVIERIDPVTGRKTNDPAMIPDDKPLTVCPHVAGFKSWIPGAYDASQATLYEPLNLACMEMEPADKGEISALSSGVRWSIVPVPGSDGRVGRLQAFDLKARKTRWTADQRSPIMTGVLATAGGLLFAGGLDRNFTAYDAANGKQLWSARLGDVPSGAPISFSVGSKQYIAVVAGYGAMLTGSYLPLVPEIPVPTTPSSSIYVFELP